MAYAQLDQRDLVREEPKEGAPSSVNSGVKTCAVCSIGCCTCFFIVIPIIWVALTFQTSDIIATSEKARIVEECPKFVCRTCCKGDVLIQLMTCPHVWIPSKFSLGPVWNPLTWFTAPFTVWNYVFGEEQVKYYNAANHMSQQVFDMQIIASEKTVIQSSHDKVKIQKDPGYYQTYDLDIATGVIHKTIYRYGNTMDIIMLPKPDTNASSLDCYRHNLGLGQVADFFVDVAKICVTPFRRPL